MILLLQNHKTYVKLNSINRITKATKKRQHTNFAYLFRNRTNDVSIGIENTFENKDIIQLYIKVIEKIIEVKGKILATLYNYTLQTCKLWVEKDENEKQKEILKTGGNVCKG